MKGDGRGVAGDGRGVDADGCGVEGDGRGVEGDGRGVVGDDESSEAPTAVQAHDHLGPFEDRDWRSSRAWHVGLFTLYCREVWPRVIAWHPKQQCY